MISLCLTTYNRTDLLYQSCEQLLDDDRVSEIVIVDDNSQAEYFNAIQSHYNGVAKVKLFRNKRNLDCYRNKREAVSKATNEWVIIGDSDNVFTKEYIDRIESLFTAGLNRNTIYQPSYAKPKFNFTPYESFFINKNNVSRHMVNAMFETMLNAMNYFVHRDEFLKVWDGSIDPVTADSIFQNYNWLMAGNSLYIVPGLHYEHRVHAGSHYQNNIRRTPRGFYNDIVNRIKSMS